jgi:hypothetical protein
MRVPPGLSKLFDSTIKRIDARISRRDLSNAIALIVAVYKYFRDRPAGLSLASEGRDRRRQLRRLYAMVENDLTDLDDILKDRIANLKSDRDRAREALARIAIHPKLNAFDVAIRAAIAYDQQSVVRVGGIA